MPNFKTKIYGVTFNDFSLALILLKDILINSCIMLLKIHYGVNVACLDVSVEKKRRHTMPMTVSRLKNFTLYSFFMKFYSTYVDNHLNAL